MDIKNQQHFSRFECSFKDLFEVALEEPSLVCKRMFGGLAFYMHGQLMLMLAESHGDTSYKGTTYPYEIWNGVLVPSRKERHSELQKEFPALIVHPILNSWLYLQVSDDNFESLCELLLRKAITNDPLIGVIPKKRK